MTVPAVFKSLLQTSLRSAERLEAPVVVAETIVVTISRNNRYDPFVLGSFIMLLARYSEIRELVRSIGEAAAVPFGAALAVL